jgi:hypothetical protein
MGQPRHQREQQLGSTGTYATPGPGDCRQHGFNSAAKGQGTERRPMKQPRPEPRHTLWEHLK